MLQVAFLFLPDRDLLFIFKLELLHFSLLNFKAVFDLVLYLRHRLVFLLQFEVLFMELTSSKAKTRVVSNLTVFLVVFKFILHFFEFALSLLKFFFSVS